MPEIPMRRRRFYVTPAFIFNEHGVSITLSPMTASLETVAPTIELGPATLTLSPIDSWYITGGGVTTPADISRDELIVDLVISRQLEATFRILRTVDVVFER